MGVVRWIVLALVAILVVGVGVVTWYYSDQIREGILVPPQNEREFEVRVHALAGGQITLDRTEETEQPGTYGLEWPGGYAQIGDIVRLTPSRVEREFRPLEGTLQAGDRVDVTSFAFPHDPLRAHGIAYEEVAVPSELGDLPGWYVPAAGDTWAIFVHGRGVGRWEALRMLPVAVDAGLPSLVITYRNDPEAPASRDGLNHLGATEWRDLEAAVDYAFDRGARNLVLVGFSTGGAIVSEFLHRSEDASAVRGVILDAPVLDWGATVDLGGQEAGLPGFLTGLAKWLASLRFGIDWDTANTLEQADELNDPILLFHGTKDDTVPVETSDALAAARPDLVTYHRVEGAWHVRSWNVDPGAYEAAVRDFLEHGLL